MKTQTPKGVRDLLPDDVDARGDVVTRLRNIFKAHGYRRIITPTVELYDVLKRGMGTNLQRQSLRFFDHNGNLMVLRPDMTTPIARVVATRMKDEPKPLKLFYSANVFRQQKAGSGKELEFYQSGIECIGTSGVDQDAEIIALAVEGMKALGLKDFMIDVGHMDLVKNLGQEQIHALEQQNYVAYGKLPVRGIEEPIRQFPYFGELYERLKKLGVEDHISFNLGLVKEIGYYTGVVFECYVRDVGYFVGSGGRYDDLIGFYGYDCPAIGFAFGVERLLLALDRERRKDT